MWHLANLRKKSEVAPKRDLAYYNAGKNRLVDIYNCSALK